MHRKSGFGSRALLSLALVSFAGLAVQVNRSNSASEPAVPVDRTESEATWATAPAANPSAPTVDAIERILYPQLLDTLSPMQQQVLIARLDDIYNSPLPTAPLAMLCFAPDTPEEVVQAFTIVDDFGGRYNQTSRWSTTASGSAGSQGDRVTLTYGFPADGVTIPTISGVSFASGPNSLNAWLNGIYGSQAAWKPVFDQTFARWSALAGITYIYEPNDDGVNFNQNPGVLGVRADLRIGAKTLDGNSGVLAYNNFPPDGDMVFDAFDSFFSDTSSSSLKIRNVIAHEHGHGMGQLHVCPILQTKLMEPFVSTAFNGPLHDDVRNAQRFYGDPFEPDNNPVQATDLGNLVIGNSVTAGNAPAPAFANSAILSIDADGEQDYFFFEVNTPASVNVTVTPIGTTYDDSDQACSGQSGSCCNGNNVNSLAIANLNVDVIGPNGVTILASGNSAAAGANEVLNGTPLQTANGYFIRVYEGNAPAETQLYKLTVTIAAPVFAPLTITLPNGAPALLVNGSPTNFDVTINPGDESLVPGTAQLFYRFNGGAFSAVPLTFVSGNDNTATLPPAACNETPEFYLSATGTTTGSINNPVGGAAAPYTAMVGPLALDDNYQSDQGWTVTNAPSGGTFDGAWQRGVPVNLNRGDPPADFDGSGSCYLTDNDPANSNSDVDNGATTLTSPSFPTATGDNISFAYWLNDFTGGLLQGGDSLRVEIATDAGGTNWVSVRNYTTASAQWRTDTLVAGTNFTASPTTRVRFIANDIGTQNVVEAGVDAFLADGCIPQGPVLPPAPNSVAASDGGSCTNVTITWNASVGADGYTVWRNIVNDSGTAQQIAADVAALMYDDNTASSGTNYFYWIQACNTNGCSPLSLPDSGFTDPLAEPVTGLNASIDSICGSVLLSWSSASGATGYFIHRNTINDFNSATVIGTSPSLAFFDNNSDPSLFYFYWVTASSDCGEGTPSDPGFGSAAQKGDFNLDGLIDGADVQGFVDAFLGDLNNFSCADLASPFGTLDDSDILEMIGILIGE